MKILLDLTLEEVRELLLNAPRDERLSKVFSAIESALEEDNPELDQKYRDAVPIVDGELECDDGAIVSKGADDGAYVMCWTWVSDLDAGIASEEGETEEKGDS